MRLPFCPLASHGFVYPLIGIAKAIRSRGHEVAFVTGAAFSETLQEEGFDRVPRGAKDGSSFEVKAWFNPVSVAVQVKHIEYALERFHADALHRVLEKGDIQRCFSIKRQFDSLLDLPVRDQTY